MSVKTTLCNRVMTFKGDSFSYPDYLTCDSIRRRAYGTYDPGLDGMRL